MKNKIQLFFLFLLGFHLSSCEKIENFTEIETPRFEGNYAPIIDGAPEEIKIVNFNIEFAKKIEEAIEELNTSENLKAADIITLQEMDEIGTEAIAKALEYNYVYYPSNRNPDGSLFGLAILSKWPIIEDEKILLPYEKPLNDRRKIAITTEISIGDQSVRVYNVHTSTLILPKAKRREQYRKLIEHLDALEESQTINHVLIAGDFNTNKSSDRDYLVDIYASAGLLWASEEVGPTYQLFSGLTQYTLDHVFTRGFELIDAGKNKETKASDHVPIWMKLKF